MNLEENLLAAVHDLEADAPLARDLAATARTRGRRLRRRRQAGLGAAAVAMIGSVIAPVAILHRPEPAPRPAVTRPSTTSVAPAPRTVIPSANWWRSPVKLPGGVIVTAVTRARVGTSTPAVSTVRDGNLVLDRSTGRVVLIPAGESVRIVDVTTGRTLGMVPGGAAHFLPDGRILVVDDTTAGLYDVTGKLVEQAALPADLRRRTLSIGTPKRGTP